MEMDKNKYDIIRLRMERTAKALRRNNMLCECAENAAEALDILQDMLDEGSTVAVGGSMSLFEAGVISELRAGEYHFLDRYEKGLTREQIKRIFRDSFSADA